MLEVKNLTKVYSGKGGVTVRALDNVSVEFPETGMVFLLGKSGSGKSTLLNVAGGLDKPDEGEVIVKGKSSKEFSGSDFDSYRNTFIGFVFQEYNILNEFTIEQNIALALQLQSKPADKKAVADLLEKVDLAGYAKRKPNTLSGGQKQRVAIARALIKEPEIIMADEPTGALDSNTGKQVLDTLKKLSKTKLVIVVSHDREFAEYYGDRIIELKDGKIISDVSKVYYSPTGIDAGQDEEQPNVAMVSDDTIAIKKSEDLTDEDVRKIAEMLRKRGGEAIITADQRDLPNVKRACKINESGNKESFKKTEKIDIKEYDGSQTKFIKSRLPLGHAIKMGASGLKSKPFRLIFTILLSVAAFVLFGVLSTFMLYDPDYSVSEALKEVDYPNVLVDKHYTYIRKSYRVDNATGKEELDYSSEGDCLTLISPKEIEDMSVNGLKFAGVYTFNNNTYENNASYSLALVKDGDNKQIQIKRESEDYYCVTTGIGFSDCGGAYLQGNGFTLTGTYPTRYDEIMLSTYLAECFVNTEGCAINNATDLIGKKVKISGSGMDSIEFKVTGIANTGVIPTKFDDLKRSGTLNEKDRDALKETLKDYLSHGFETLIYVSDDFYETISKRIQQYNNSPYINSQYANKIRLDRYYIDDSNVDGWGLNYYTEKILERNKQILIIHNLDGSIRTDLSFSDDEVIVSQSKYNEIINDYMYSHSFNPVFDPEAYAELNGDGSWESGNMYDSSVREARIAAAEKWYSTLAYRESLYYLIQNYLYWNMHSRLDYWDLSQEEKDFLLGFENDTDDEDVVALAAYVTEHMQLYYGIMTERQMNSRGWTDAFVESGEDPYEVISDLKSESYSAEEFATRKEKIDAWFEEGSFSIDIPDRFTFDYKSADSYNAVFYVMPSAERAFLNLFEKIKTYVESSDKSDTSLVLPTAADWNVLYAYVKAARPQLYYGWLVEYLNNQNPSNAYTEADSDQWTIVSNLKSESYSEEDFTAMKGRIDAWITSIGASKEAKTNYVFNIANAVSQIHYCDKYGTRGMLRVIGYGENMNAEYCLTESFISNHAEADTNGYSWYDTLESDYVQPADARYNKMISLTDNSLSQVSSAQSKDKARSVFYQIDNDVVEKLNYFLEMISDLEEIFLYVGLGVGVLAAFFLLNFISVSISTKRKDIGILRAVGARGSDVFKIFYAESFLIAFICFVLASVGSFILCFFLNRTLEIQSVTLNLLHFGPINIALVFGISIFVSVIATFFPVYFAARKSPVEAIRAL